MEARRQTNFLTEIVEADLAAGKNGGRVVTRFPPEPNGFLHIGHAKSILLNFGIARQYGGRAHLRFDDTNPTTEDVSYVESIEQDVKWLGADWGDHLHFASDYFPKMYDCAVRLVKDGRAFVDSQSVDAIREQRGSFERPGTNSPYRNRPVAENLDLLTRMRAGEFQDGACVLRAKIDMAHPNVLLRDPLLYRIRHADHHRTGNAWCIYPMYDYAHPLEDAFEGVTHSICTLEFESNRELYDWVLDNLGPWDPRPHQYEFARLALGYTVMSKRKLLQLVTDKHVTGWDDPRMPTIAGLRRRGVTPEALRDFAELIGVAKSNSLVDIGKLEFAIRADLETRTPRAFAVLNPLKVVIANWPRDRIEELDVAWWPGEASRGSRKVPFGGEVLIEREDFSEDPPKEWKRLAPGREVRLMNGYVVKCDDVVREASGEIRELRCSYDPGSSGGNPSDKRKVSGTLHWVHATRSVPIQVRNYDRLFTVEQPDAEGDFVQYLNPGSLTIAKGARGEPALAEVQSGSRLQFLRQGYFFADPIDSAPGVPVFNRIIGLKDTWTKVPDKKEERRPEKTRETPAATPKKRSEARDAFRANSPELAERFVRYQTELGVSRDDADVLTGDLELARFFDGAIARHRQASSVAKWLLNDLMGLMKHKPMNQLHLSAADFGDFVALVDAGRLAPGAAKTVLARLVENGGTPEAVIRELGLDRVEGAEALDAAVRKVLAEHGTEVERYRAGEKKLLGVFIGAVMKETHGAVDAAAVRSALARSLG
jgi:glutaminyl-tRNA synthetase